MHFKIFLPLFAAALLLSFGVLKADIKESAGITEPAQEETMIYAYVNGERLTIQPAENSSADAFLALLAQGDLTVEMHDYGSFEKVGSLGATLPTNDETITTQPGDVILYQGNSITIYYDTNTWAFTRLGKVQNMTQEELTAILGDGDVTVTFSTNGGS